MDWTKYSFVVRGKNRSRTLKHLKSPMTPSQLATASNVSLSHISKALRDLRKEGLVECINPKEKVGKIYRRTKEGEEVVEQMGQAVE
jgi:DNA-binding transcriptional ArsR family regulator